MRIEVAGIAKYFGDFHALDDVSLTIPKGSLTALLRNLDRMNGKAG